MLSWNVRGVSRPLLMHSGTTGTHDHLSRMPYLTPSQHWLKTNIRLRLKPDVRAVLKRSTLSGFNHCEAQPYKAEEEFLLHNWHFHHRNQFYLFRLTLSIYAANGSGLYIACLTVRYRPGPLKAILPAAGTICCQLYMCLTLAFSSAGSSGTADIIFSLNRSQTILIVIAEERSVSGATPSDTTRFGPSITSLALLRLKYAWRIISSTSKGLSARGNILFSVGTWMVWRLCGARLKDFLRCP